MKLNKRKKSKELSKKKPEVVPLPKEKMIKFNLSYDNLVCFISDKHPKTDRKRATNRYNFNLTGNKKFKEDFEEDGLVEVKHKIIRQCSPDPSRQASNEIIEQIQKKGLKCVWNQIEETKTEGSNEQQWQQTQLLRQTFSECSSSYGKNHSHASTLDHYPGYFTQRQGRTSDVHLMVPISSSMVGHSTVPSNDYMINEKQKYYETSVFEISVENIGKDPRTTLMIKNIPNKYTVTDLQNEINVYFKDSFDFLYLPCDIKNNCNVGYGFINFINTDVLIGFYKHFHNKKWMKFRSEKICVLTYARLQGLQSLIDHFQNSKVLNHKDKRYQPIIRRARSCGRINELIKQQKDESQRGDV